MIKQILKSPQAVIGLLLMIAVLAAAFLCPILAPHDPEQTNLLMKYAAPCAEYPLGADELGRCELSRLLYGTR